MELKFPILNSGIQSFILYTVRIFQGLFSIFATNVPYINQRLLDNEVQCCFSFLREDRESRLQTSKMAMATVFKTWPGMLVFIASLSKCPKSDKKTYFKS